MKEVCCMQLVVKFEKIKRVNKKVKKTWTFKNIKFMFLCVTFSILLIKKSSATF